MTFEQLFVGGEFAFGTFDEDAPEDEKAKTIREQVGPKDYENHLSGEMGLGLVPVRKNQTCRFAAIDIDDDDIDHKRLYQEVTRRKLPLAVCRSRSGGAHLYAFFKEPGRAADNVAVLLRTWADSLGYPGVEIFPKQKTASLQRPGNWINLPYFHVDKTVRYAIGKEGSLTLEKFLSSIDWYDEVRGTSIINVSIATLPPCLEKLTTLKVSEGARNNGLFNWAVFYRKSSPGDWKEKTREANRKYLVPPIGSTEVEAILMSLETNEYEYLCALEPIVAHCNYPVCTTLPFGIGKGQHKDRPGTIAYQEVNFTDLRKYDCDPPRYILAVNGIDMALSSEEFQTYFKLKRRILELLNLVVRPQKQSRWEEKVIELLRTHVEIKTPSEVSTSGEIMEMLDEFLAFRGGAKGWESIQLGSPFEHEGVVYFRPADFQKFLIARRTTRVEKNELYTILERGGVKNRTKVILGKRCKLWSYPTKDINEQKEDFNLEDLEFPTEEI